MVKNNITCLDDAKKELHNVSVEIREIQKKFGIPKRSRDISGFKRIIRHFGNSLYTNNVKYNGIFRESMESKYFHLLKNKYWLQGYIASKMNIGPKLSYKEEKVQHGN